MTIEQKAKAYDKAIEKIKYVMEHGVSPTLNKEDLEDIFPELAESEDERIRKRIICGMNALKDQKKKTFATIPIDDCIAWLEKQGEQKEDVYSKEFWEEIRKNLSDFLQELCERGMNTNFDRWTKSDCVNWLLWVEKQAEKKKINPTLQEKDRMDDAFTKMMLKPQVDGFDAELNALLDKYGYLPKDEVMECFKSHLGVVQGEQKQKWTDEDEIGSDATIELLEYFINYAPEFRKPAIRESIDWLKSLKQRMEE